MISFTHEIATDEEPYYRAVNVEGTVIEGGSPSMHDPGYPPSFEVTSLTWADDDPLDGEGDLDALFNRHEDQIQEAGLEEAERRHRNRFSGHPRV